MNPLTEPPDPTPADNPRFWLQDLRLGRYAELLRHIDDADYRRERVATWFTSRRVLLHVAGRLGLSTAGTIADLQARLVAAGRRLLPFLAVAAFAPRKLPVAVLDVAQAELEPEALEQARDRKGKLDRLLLLLLVFERRPQALAHVRGLQAWHRQAGAALVLADRRPRRSGDFGGFLTRAHIERAIASVPLPRGVPGVRHEMTIPREQDGHIVVLSRNLRRTHNWTDDGQAIQHGHDEELIVLQFTDEGRRVRASGRTTSLPRALADAIATAWFGAPSAYVDDLTPAEPASLDRMLAALLLNEVEGLRLVELAVRAAPLPGAPELVLRTHDPAGDITAAVFEFESKVGPLLDRLDDVLHLKLCFPGKPVEVDFPRVGDRPLPRFADGRLDRHAARALHALVQAQFGLPLHTMEARCA